MLRILICATLVTLPLFSTTGFAGDKKSWQECHDLAVSRGLTRTRVWTQLIHQVRAAAKRIADR
jgi:hypothetical protein